MENRTLFLGRSSRSLLIGLALFAAMPSIAASLDSVIDAAAVNEVSPSVPLQAGASGAAVLRAQILLERASFSPGEIDGRYGSNMKLAVAAFQSARGLDDSGVLDAPTWEALNTQAAAGALVQYEISAADIAGPFAKIPVDMMEKSTLPALGYASPLEALGEKFHASPDLLRRLNPGADFAKAGEQILVPNVVGISLSAPVARILIDKSDAGLQLLDAEDKVLARYPASTGSEHDPLPIGEWKVTGVATDPVFHYNPALFWDADPKNEKAKIAPGPNNPVGSVWIDLSKEHYGVHGTPEPSKIGKTESHGCIRLTNWSARSVAEVVRAGTPVTMRE
ncbi:L,D-transpeptidase family protein [Arenimonas sp.]|uniref:L,D-transpeptidase family protein n=1 Tax=Arenimonas sp. TaxID=1872635 RepID=UPI0039E600ED